MRLSRTILDTIANLKKSGHQLKKIFALILFSISLFSCDLCRLQVPVVHTQLEISKNQANIQILENWEFDKNFTKEVLLSYGVNDSKPSQAKLDDIKKSLEEYLSQNQFLSFGKIQYDKQKSEMIFKKQTSKLWFQNNQLFYFLTLQSTLKNQELNSIDIKIDDNGKFFNFLITSLKLINFGNAASKIQNNQVFIYQNPQKSHVMDTEMPSHPKQETNENFLRKYLEKLKNKISQTISNIKNQESASSYIWLFIFSFFYGVLHAIGPGHGKSLVSSYLLQSDESIQKGLALSVAIGFVHTFSSFILVLSIFSVINLMAPKELTQIESITTQISAIIIIAIGLTLLYKKIKNSNKRYHFSATPHNSCGCLACKNQTNEDIAIVLASGIIPCPGVVTIFIFCISLNAIYVGFLSAFFVSVGMSIVIFAVSYISIKSKQKISNNRKLTAILEYFSLIFIILLGIILFTY